MRATPRLRYPMALFAFSILFPFVVYSLGLDPAKEPRQYGHDVWQEDEGLPQNSVNSIAQTPDGYLWLGTQEGLVRFDGVKFEVFDKTNTKEMKVNHVTVIHAGKDSSLWFGTRGGGVMRLKDKRFTSYGSAQGLKSDEILSLLESRDGSMWVGTDGGGLARLQNGTFKNYSEEDGLRYRSIYSLWEDSSGTLWIGAPRGLSSYRNGSFKVYTEKEGFPGGFVWHMFGGKDGSLWLSLSQNGLARMKDGAFTVFTMNDGLSSDEISALYEDNHGTLWIGTGGGGVNRLSNGVFTSYGEKDGLSGGMISSLFVDHEGSLWIGTEGAGLNRLRDTKFLAVGRPEGLSGEMITAMASSRSGGMWIGTAGNGLNFYKDGKTIVYTTKNGLSNDFILSLFEEQDGTLWIGTSGGGVDRLVDGRFSGFDTADGLMSNFVSALTADGNGGMWIGTRVGLNHYSDGQFTSFSSYNGLSSSRVLSLLAESDGTLWIGTARGGLNKYKDGTFTNISTKEGLSDNSIWTFYKDADGNMWIGTNGSGLNLLRPDGSISVFTTKHGLTDDMIFSIAEDHAGNLWMSSNRGIFRTSKRELHEVASGRSQRVACITYGKADGMRSRECNGGYQPPVVKTAGGVLWFPTIKGAVSIDPEHMMLNPHPPRVTLEQVFVDQEPIDLTSAVTLTPGKGRYEFYYTGLSFSAPQFVTFKYKLEGFDKEWIDAGKARVAYYTNLSPGTYRFRVIAANSDGVWNTEGASYSFVLSPHFYQSNWFYGLCVISVILAGFGVHKIHLRHVRTKELVYLVNERTRDLMEAKDRTEHALVVVREAQGKIKEQATLLDKAQDAIFVADFDQVIQFWNQGAERLYGWTSAEAVGQNAFTLLHNRQESDDSDCLEAVRMTGEWSGEFEQTTKDGRCISAESRWTLVRDESGQPKSILVINTDITEKKKITAQFLRAQRMQSLGTLAGGIAHDLNNVLSPILLSIEFLRMKISDPSSQRALDTMESSAQRGASIIKQVLAFSRGVEGQRSAVHLKYIIGELQKIIQETFPRSIRLFVDVQKDLWSVSGDPTQLYQVVMNLCVNARDAMTDGGELRITAENRILDQHYVRAHTDARPGNYIVVTISDTGSGIPQNIIDKIFEPFFTTKELGKGTGLGLSTALGIIKSHGGFVNVYSEPLKGAKFDVYLPADSTSVEGAAKIQQHSRLPRGNGELVLVVDDESAIREANISMLESYGYKALAASNGVEAIQIMLKYRGLIKIVITDMMMPIMDGSMTIKRLREIDSSLKFIAVSGLMGDQKLSEIAALGTIEFLQKPFTTDRLLNVLHESLSRN